MVYALDAGCGINCLLRHEHAFTPRPNQDGQDERMDRIKKNNTEFRYTPQLWMLRTERRKGIINCQLRSASSALVNQGSKSSLRQSPILNILRQATQLLIGAFSYPEYPFILTIQIQTFSRGRLRRLKCILSLRLLQLAGSGPLRLARLAVSPLARSAALCFLAWPELTNDLGQGGTRSCRRRRTGRGRGTPNAGSARSRSNCRRAERGTSPYSIPSDQ
jgi:hypothetical protein